MSRQETPPATANPGALPIEADIDGKPLVPEPTAETLQKPPRGTAAWVNTTYFAEGLPYMIVIKLATVFFTDIGMSLKSIGYLNFLATPWNLKFLWAPFLDVFGTKRQWLIVVQALIGLITLGIAALCYMTPLGGDMHANLRLIAIALVTLAFVAATNDVAIDAHYMEAIPDRRNQAGYSGYRVMAYRVAVVFVNFGLVALAASSRDKNLAWAYAFGAAGATMLLMSAFHAFTLPRREVAKKGQTPSYVMAEFGRAFWSYLSQDKVALILLFIVTYKIGDEILFSMNTPFLMRELGVTKPQLAWLGGVVGAATTVAGALLGAWWIKKKGLRKAIWPLTILMNFNIWAYIWLAWARPMASTTQGFATIAVVHGYEQVAAALGNAVLLVFLLGTCKPEYKAAHYAIGTAIMSLPTRFIGGFGGVAVEKIGYLNFFLLAFLVTLPSMLLLFVVPIRGEDDAFGEKVAPH